MCQTCIYRPGLPLDDLKNLEDEVRDPHIGFKGYRSCHHHADADTVCCRGFWDKHKDEFPLGQVAQRLDVVEFTNEGDEFKDGYGSPACAGIDPVFRKSPTPAYRFPRMRGDRPATSPDRLVLSVPPHARG